jgi:hypothetical protein
MKSFKLYITEVQRYEMSLPSVQDIGAGLYNLGINHLINSTIDPLYWTRPLQPIAQDVLTTLPYMMPGVPINAVDSTESIPPEMRQPEGDGWYWYGPSIFDGEWYQMPRPEGNGWIWDDGQNLWYNTETGESKRAPSFTPAKPPKPVSRPKPKPGIDPTRWYPTPVNQEPQTVEPTPPSIPRLSPGLGSQHFEI